MGLIGDWEFRWTRADLSTATLALRVPPQRRRSAHRKRRFVNDSLDYSVREVVTVGGGRDELLFDLRLEEDHDLLLEFLVAGADGREITMDDGLGNTRVVFLIDPSEDVVGLLNDPDDIRRLFGEYSLNDVRVRAKVAGEDFSFWL